MKRILGIGSALVDILTQIPDEQLLQELNLPKGIYIVKVGETARRITVK